MTANKPVPRYIPENESGGNNNDMLPVILALIVLGVVIGLLCFKHML